MVFLLGMTGMAWPAMAHAQAHSATAANSGVSRGTNLPTATSAAPSSVHNDMAPSAMYGEWFYYVGVLSIPGQSTITVPVGGSLKLLPDGTFDDGRKIGNIVNAAAGSFSVAGDQLIFQNNDGSPDSIYTYILSTAIASGGGNEDVLTLISPSPDGSQVTFTLKKDHA